jgi:hypothetical protein
VDVVHRDHDVISNLGKQPPQLGVQVDIWTLLILRQLLRGPSARTRGQHPTLS